MRCGDIRRCGGKSNKNKRTIGSGVNVIKGLDERTGAFECNIFVTKNGESYFNINADERTGALIVTPHGEYETSEGGQAILNLLEQLGETNAVLMVGLTKNNTMLPPFDGGQGTYIKTAMDIFNTAYEKPTEENINNMSTYLQEVMQAVLQQDFDTLFLRWSNMPQLIINITSRQNEDCTGEECIETDERFGNISTSQIKLNVGDVITYDYYEGEEHCYPNGNCTRCTKTGDVYWEKLLANGVEKFRSWSLPTTSSIICSTLLVIDPLLNEGFISEIDEHGQRTVLKSGTVELCMMTEKYYREVRLIVGSDQEMTPHRGNYHISVNGTRQGDQSAYYTDFGSPEDFAGTTFSLLGNNVLAMHCSNGDEVTLEPYPTNGFKFVQRGNLPSTITVDSPFCEDAIVEGYFTRIDDLLSYEELVVLDANSLVNELNRYAAAYFEKLFEEGYMTTETPNRIYTLNGTEVFYRWNYNRREKNR